MKHTFRAIVAAHSAVSFLDLPNMGSFTLVHLSVLLFRLLCAAETQINGDRHKKDERDEMRYIIKDILNVLNYLHAVLKAIFKPGINYRILWAK